MNATVSLNEGDEIEGIEITDDSDSDDEVSEIEMKKLLQLQRIIDNVRRVAFLQLLSFFIFLVISVIVTQRYAWTKAIHQSTFMFFNFEMSLYLKTVSSIYPFMVGIYSWYLDSFRKPCFRVSLYRHFLCSSVVDLIFSFIVFCTGISSFHHKIKSVMPSQYYVVSISMSVCCCLGNIYILRRNKILLLYSGDDEATILYTSINPSMDMLDHDSSGEMSYSETE